MSRAGRQFIDAICAILARLCCCRAERKSGRIRRVYQIEAKDLAGKDVRVHYDVTPDECPICQHGIDVIRTGNAYVSARTAEPNWAGYLEICYRCPRASCGRMFCAIYRQHIQVGSGDRNYFFFCGIYPCVAKPPEVPKSIQELSPSFVNIYTQALEAERAGLNEVCGPALRRALEFLIKDYLIQNKAASEETIKGTPLGTCIHNYVADSNVKICADRATWLGNDATHYDRKYSAHDITHLKELISLTTYWLSSEVMTKKYRDEITKK